MISAGRPDSAGGGGVVAEIFRDHSQSARFSGGGGGGGSSRIFSESQSAVFGGGRTFFGTRRSSSLKCDSFGTFFGDIFARPGHSQKFIAQKKHLQEVWGGGHGPPGPPPGYATV